jgi:hypothetical protein
MKKTAVFVVLVALCMLAMVSTALALTTVANYATNMKSYNMNDIGSGSTYYGINCGETAAAEVLAYWDLNNGKDDVWNPDSDLTGNGVNPNLHLCNTGDLHCTVGIGTTPTEWQAGMQKHLRGTCGNAAPASAAPLMNYTTATTTLYQKTGGTTFATMWSTIKTEIAANRPVALFLGHYPTGYNSTILYQYYNYHWQVIYGYDETGGAHSVYTRTGFASTGLFDLQTYWNYTKSGVGIDNIAIVRTYIP